MVYVTKSHRVQGTEAEGSIVKQKSSNYTIINIYLLTRMRL